MSLVIDLIGDLNCHVIGCKSAFRSVYCSGQSMVNQTVSSVCCLFVLLSLISRLQGAGGCWHRFSSVCFKLVNHFQQTLLESLDTPFTCHKSPHTIYMPI